MSNNVSPSSPHHVPPSKQPRSFPSTEQIKEMLNNNQCFVRFRDSGSSDVWKLFEEVCYKSNSEFTGLIRCTRCHHMARYHGHITGTSHMRRHRCFGDLFPDTKKTNSTTKDSSISSNNHNNSSNNNTSLNNSGRNNSITSNSNSVKRTMSKPGEKKSICLENGGESASPSKRQKGNQLDSVEGDSVSGTNDANASTNSVALLDNSTSAGDKQSLPKIELRTYNNQTVIAPKVKNALAGTILAFCYNELVDLKSVCSPSFKNILKSAAVKVSTPLVLNHQYLNIRAQELYINEKDSIKKGITDSVERNVGGAIVSDFKDDLCIMSYSYIDQDWKIQDKVLRGATRIDNILEFISRTLRDYGLLQDSLINKFTYISNAGQLSGVDIHLSSASHLLDNMIESVVFEGGKHDQLLDNCKFICSELKILPENSISSWIYKYDVIMTVLDNLHRFSPGNFSMDTMLPEMQQLRSLLSSFREASVLMRTDVHEIPTINQVALQYFKLKKELTPVPGSETEDQPDFVEHKKRLLESLETKFKLHLRHKIAVFFWPNFRHLKMFSDSERVEVYSEVRKMLEGHELPQATEENVDDSIKAQTQYSEWEAEAELNEMDEVSRYLSDKFNHCNEKTLLTWWKEASKRYPKLSQVAKSILAVPASVTSIERRPKLHPRPPIDEELMFLHCNLATN